MNNQPKTIREFAASVNFHVIGRLRRVAGNTTSDGTKTPPYWLDEAGNEYMGNARDGFCIVATDGAVW